MCNIYADKRGQLKKGEKGMQTKSERDGGGYRQSQGG